MKSDSDHNSQMVMSEDGKVINRHEVNCPSESSKRCGTSPVKSENSSLVASARENITKPLSREPVSHSSRTRSPDTLTEPVQLPEWPPPMNTALTMDERLSHWDSFV